MNEYDQSVINPRTARTLYDKKTHSESSMIQRNEQSRAESYDTVRSKHRKKSSDLRRRRAHNSVQLVAEIIFVSLHGHPIDEVQYQQLSVSANCLELLTLQLAVVRQCSCF